MLTRIHKLFIVILAAGAAVIQPSTAPGYQSQGEWVKQGPVSVRLISERTGFNKSEGIRLGVHVRLADGWLTYWRAPGEAGMPPVFDWSGSQNLGPIREITWPLPRNEDSFGHAVRVYRDEVVLPVTASAIDSTKPLELRLAFTMAICKDVCVPIRTEHWLVLQPGPGNPVPMYENARLIEKFTRRAPVSDPLTCGLRIKAVKLPETDGAEGLRITVQAEEAIAAPAVLVEDTPGQLPHLAKLGSTQDGKDWLHWYVPEGLSTLAPRYRRGKEWVYWYIPSGKFDPAQWQGRRLKVTVLESGRGLEQIWVVGTVADRTGAWGQDMRPAGREITSGQDRRPLGKTQ